MKEIGESHHLSYIVRGVTRYRVVGSSLVDCGGGELLFVCLSLAVHAVKYLQGLLLANIIDGRPRWHGAPIRRYLFLLNWIDLTQTTSSDHYGMVGPSSLLRVLLGIEQLALTLPLYVIGMNVYTPFNIFSLNRLNLLLLLPNFKVEDCLW